MKQIEMLAMILAGGRGSRKLQIREVLYEAN